ncbi:hypothetical protein VU13_01785 [Desulfobulbus sp. US5]|nr:hypothetical protein [Desulfobulbus sp. US5]
MIEFIQRHAERTEEAIRLDLESALVGNDPLLLEVLKYSCSRGGSDCALFWRFSVQDSAEEMMMIIFTCWQRLSSICTQDP